MECCKKCRIVGACQKNYTFAPYGLDEEDIKKGIESCPPCYRATEGAKGEAVEFNEKLTDSEKELFENLWQDLRVMYQRDVAMADNGIPFRHRIEDFIKKYCRKPSGQPEAGGEEVCERCSCVHYVTCENRKDCTEENDYPKYAAGSLLSTPSAKKKGAL